MATLQVRSIEPQFYEALGRLAAAENRSISQEVIAILKRHLSAPYTQHQVATQRFLELAGSWQDDREADEIISDIRSSRKNRGRIQDAF